jgi:RimJ/RimL family protein N-acetyltransferase
MSSVHRVGGGAAAKCHGNIRENPYIESMSILNPRPPTAIAPPALAPAAPTADHAPGAVVPIRSIGQRHLPAIEAHLLALGPQDRYLRFGYAATDEHILNYIGRLNFERDQLFGIFNRKLKLIAMAHLAFSVDPHFKSCAEFGVSVTHSARARGYGSQLFSRAIMHARNEGVNQLFIHALSENTAMLKIARRAGARIERDGSESEAHLVLPSANFDSRVIELFNEQVAITDYHLKARARRFWAFLSMLQGERSEGSASAAFTE